MQYIHTGPPKGTKGANQWTINKPLLTIPEITGTKDEDGIRYYTGPGDKLYIASLFDKMFNAPKGLVVKKVKGKVIINQF